MSAKEAGRDVAPLKKFIAADASLTSTEGGKNNLYKIFIARSFELLADGGHLSFIVPMAVLGDEQASGIRRQLLAEGAFCAVDAFPQKDVPSARVFRDAKLSTALFHYRKSLDPDVRARAFPTRAHPAQYVLEGPEPLLLDATSILRYDPSNLTILSCSRTDWDLFAELNPGRVSRLRDYARFFQGEVNETNARANGHLTTPERGRLVTRGACVCLYQIRDASQGEDLFIDVARFAAGAETSTKVHHHRHERVVLQESSPQNNFRRIIAARLATGNLCNHTINYTTDAHSRVNLSLILFVLNSVFAEWYFRLGSTNAHVSQYQLLMIPSPRFGTGDREVDQSWLGEITGLLLDDNLDLAASHVADLARDGCSATLEAAITSLVELIEAEERSRGAISRSQRSLLSARAARAQELLDETYLTLIGFKGRLQTFQKRLAAML